MPNRREWLLASLTAGAAGCTFQDVPEPVPASGDDSPMARMLQYARGLERTQIVHAAAELGIADLLAGGPKTTEDLARATQTHTPSLYRLMRALVSMGIFAQRQANEFALAEMGEYLRSDHPESLRPLVLWNGAGWRMRAWAGLTASIRTGGTAMNRVFGMGLYEYMRQNPRASEVLRDVMTLTTRKIAGALVDSYDFSGIGTVADIGGGEGLLLATILQANPNMKGVLFELPEVASSAAEFLEEEGVSDRIEIVAGDFFESVPPADTYLLMRVLQDWTDKEAVRILESCRRAIRPGGTVLIIEKVVEADATTLDYPITDIHMLVESGGKERTREQFRELLDRAGFKMGRTIPLPADLGDGYPPSIIEGLT